MSILVSALIFQELMTQVAAGTEELEHSVAMGRLSEPREVGEES